jgi:hypothetical protein
VTAGSTIDPIALPDAFTELIDPGLLAAADWDLRVLVLIELAAAASDSLVVTASPCCLRLRVDRVEGFDVEGPVYFEWTDDEVADALAGPPLLPLLVAELCMMRGEEEESESEMGKCGSCCCCC